MHKGHEGIAANTSSVLLLGEPSGAISCKVEQASPKSSIYSHMRNLLGGNKSIMADKGLAGRSHSHLSCGSEGNIGATGVAATERPLCLAVADDEDARGRHERGGAGR